jgi:hypothetical protein
MLAMDDRSIRVLDNPNPANQAKKFNDGSLHSGISGEAATHRARLLARLRNPTSSKVATQVNAAASATDATASLVPTLALPESVVFTDPASATFSIARSGGGDDALPVSVMASGVAEAGQGNASILATFTIPAGEKSVTVPVSSVFPMVISSGQVSLLPSDSYRLGTSSRMEVVAAPAPGL